MGVSAPAQLILEPLIVVSLCVAAGMWGVFQFSQFEFIKLCRGFDLWFDSDPARTVANITSRWVPFHERSNLHPLYSLFIAAPFGVIGEVFKLSTSAIVMWYVAVQAAAYASGAYIVMRLFGLMRLDALLGVLLIFSTAAGIFWIGFPEWIAFGATAVFFSLAWVAVTSSLRNQFKGVVQNLLSGSIVVTGWAIGVMASLVADWPKLQWAEAYRHTRDALALMAALTVVQYFVFPTAGGFLNIWLELKIAAEKGAANIATYSLVAPSIEFFAQTLLAPEVKVLGGPRTVPGWGVLITTSQGQGVTINILSAVVLIFWIALWVLGLVAAIQGNLKRPVVVMVIGALTYFYMLHMMFGGEIFLFSLYFAPLMVFIALWGVFSRHRVVIRCLCAALIAASAVHNYPSFRSAVAIHNAIDLSWLEREATASAFTATMDCR